MSKTHDTFIPTIGWILGFFLLFFSRMNFKQECSALQNYFSLLFVSELTQTAAIDCHGYLLLVLQCDALTVTALCTIAD